MIRKLFTHLIRRARPKRSMAYRLFLIISLSDQAITRDRAILRAAQQRINRAEQRRAWAQRRLCRPRRNS